MADLDARRCSRCGFAAVKLFAMSPCGHLLCQDCARTLGGPTAKCPVCAKFGEVHAVSGVPELDRHTFVQCPLADPFAYRAGAPRCTWEGPLADVSLHVERDCPLKDMSCWYAGNGCTFTGQRWQMAAHEAQCEFRPIKCQYCGSEQPSVFLAEHEGHCPERLVECPNKCDKALRLKLGQLAEHLQTCPAARPSCDICALCQTLGKPAVGSKPGEAAAAHLETDHESKLLMLKHHILEGEDSLREAMLGELETLLREKEALDEEITRREEKVMLLDEQLSIPPEIRPSRAPSKLIDVTLLRSKTQNELIKAYMDSALAQLQDRDARITELRDQLQALRQTP